MTKLIVKAMLVTALCLGSMPVSANNSQRGCWFMTDLDGNRAALVCYAGGAFIIRVRWPLPWSY